MQQTTLLISNIINTKISTDGRICTPEFSQVCPSCGHVMPEQLNVCWWCGYVLNRRLVELAKEAKA